MNKKNRNLSILGIAVFGLLWLTYHSWESTLADFNAMTPKQKPVIQVFTAPVKNTQIEHWISAQGTARAVKKEHLAFEVDGKVIALGKRDDGQPLREGSQVKAGQLLAKLEDKDYQQQVNIAQSEFTGAQTSVNSAKARLIQAQSELNLAKKRFDRFSKLQAKGVSSKQALDDAKAALAESEAEFKVSQAQLSASRAHLIAAKNSLDQAELNLKRTSITAPWDGTIARLNIRIGDYSGPYSLDLTSPAQMDATFPITVIDATQYEVSVDVSSTHLTSLKEGAIAKIRTADTSKVDHQQWQSAFVYSIAPAMSPTSRNIRVKLRTDQKQLDLLDGEWVNTQILSQNKQALVIPMQAIIYRDNKPTVFTLDAGHQVTQRTIKLGIRQHNHVEVTEGLKPNMQVVTEGKKRLASGDNVKVISPAGGDHE